MIQVNDSLWIGDSRDEHLADLAGQNITAILNVAHDLQCTTGWKHGIEYMHVGLIDGPGNEPSAYCAAVLALSALLGRHKGILICDHDGGRSLAVAAMYVHQANPIGMSAYLKMVKERTDKDLPHIHEAHRKALDTINWRLVRGIIG